MSQIDIFDEIIVDNFAGGGGASTGIELAAGRPVAIAINHDPDAILLHKTNHPYTEHLQASVWDVDPVAVCRGRPVGLAWFSPDCKHFSKAKGAALVDRNIRGLAWIVLRWAAMVRPRVIMLENVEEFQTWGPVRKGKPVKSKAGQTFRKWKQQLSDLGYTIDHRELVAADYGAPTTRKRFVLVARCDGKPIVWPERTHAPRDSEEVKSGECLPWRAAAEIIDWTIPGYSIFESKQEIMERYGVKVVRPLAENTMRRVIRGVDKFTIRSGKPFVVPIGYGERKGQAPRVHDIEQPVSTVVSTVKQNLCEPVMIPYTFSNTGGSVGADIGDPVHTVRTGGGGQILASPKMKRYKYSEEEEWASEDRLIKMFNEDEHRKEKSGVVSVSMMSIGQTGGGDRIRDIRDPVPTTVSKQEACCVAANLIQYHTEQTEAVRASVVGGPINTVDASNRYGLTCASLTEYYGNGVPLDISEPMHTVTAHDREALTAAHIVEFKGRDIGQSVTAPMRTITASAGEFAQCRAVLCKADRRNLGHWPEIRELLNRHCGYALAEDDVILLLIGGAYYYIADITLRMLTPRELYNAMGFPPDYIIDHDYMGNAYGKTKQVARCGNAVCPPMAEAMVRANLTEWCGEKITTMAQLDNAVAI